MHPAGVEGRAGVAHEEHAGVAVGDRLGDGGLLVDRPRGTEPDVAVHVDEPRQHPAGELTGGAALGGAAGEADPALAHPELAHLALVAEEDMAAHVQRDVRD